MKVSKHNSKAALIPRVYADGSLKYAPVRTFRHSYGRRNLLSSFFKEPCRPYSPTALSTALRKNGQIIGITAEDGEQNGDSIPSTNNPFILVGQDAFSLENYSLLPDGPSSGQHLTTDSSFPSFYINPNNQLLQSETFEADLNSSGFASMTTSFLGQSLPGGNSQQTLAKLRLIAYDKGRWPTAFFFPYGANFEVLATIYYNFNSPSSISISLSEGTFSQSSFTTSSSISDDGIPKFFSFTLFYGGNFLGAGHDPVTSPNLLGDIQVKVLVLDIDGTELINETFNTEVSIDWPGNATYQPEATIPLCTRIWNNKSTVPAYAIGSSLLSENTSGSLEVLSNDTDFKISHLGLNYVEPKKVALGLKRNQSTYEPPGYCNLQ